MVRHTIRRGGKKTHRKKKSSHRVRKGGGWGNAVPWALLLGQKATQKSMGVSKVPGPSNYRRRVMKKKSKKRKKSMKKKMKKSMKKKMKGGSGPVGWSGWTTSFPGQGIANV